MPDKVQCRTPEGVEYELELPDVEVKCHWECRHEVMVDNQRMEIIRALRYLLADRERILTKLADMQSQLHQEQSESSQQ